MNISAHWKVFDRSGAEIDAIEKTLHEIEPVLLNRDCDPYPNSPISLFGDELEIVGHVDD